MSSRLTQSKSLSQKSKLKKCWEYSIVAEHLAWHKQILGYNLGTSKKRETIDILIYHVTAAAESQAF